MLGWLLRRCHPLCLGSQPEFFRNDGLMLALVFLVLVMLDAAELVALAFNLLQAEPAIHDLARIHRVVQDALHGKVCEQGILAVLAEAPAVAVIVEPFGDAGIAQVAVDELIEDQPDEFGLFLVDDESTVLAAFVPHDPVAQRGLPAVPSALPGFLLAPGLGLGLDILALQLGNASQDRKQYLPSGGRGVDAVLDTDQIDTIVLHELEIGQHVGGVPAEPGQLEHQDIAHVVWVAAPDQAYHLCELRSAGRVLA